jgi:hypothetical protein
MSTTPNQSIQPLQKLLRARIAKKAEMRKPKPKTQTLGNAEHFLQTQMGMTDPKARAAMAARIKSGELKTMASLQKAVRGS